MVAKHGQGLCPCKGLCRRIDVVRVQAVEADAPSHRQCRGKRDCWPLNDTNLAVSRNRHIEK